jgi:phenylacetate-CoA ligase
MNNFFDALETRDPAAREAALLGALPLQVAHAKLASPALAQLLQDVDPFSVNSREALSLLPVTRKHELLERQLASRKQGGNVFGGFSAVGFGTQMPRVFASPGPSMNPKVRVRITGAWRAPFLRLASGLAN